MSFTLELTDDQRDLVLRAGEFSREVIRPAAPDYDRRQEFPWEVLEEAARRGFYEPQFYGGLIRDPTGLSLPLVMEEIFWGCAGIGLSIVMPALALSAIAQAATPEQMGEWAPRCFGSPGDLKLAALAVTEPSGGSDVRSIQTRARRDGDDWVIDGHKVFIGNGGIADVHVVLATVDPEAGHRGQAFFIVEKDTPGLEMLRKLDKLGCRASHTAELLFEDCRVPGDHLLGGDEKLEAKIAKGREAEAEERREEAQRRSEAEQRRESETRGAGTPEDGGAAPRRRRGSAALGAFEQTRPMVAAQAIGIARAAYEYARDYAVEREAFGRPIVEHQGVAFPLADLAADIDAARLLTWRAAWMAASRSGTATPSSTRSSREPARSSGS